MKKNRLLLQKMKLMKKSRLL